YPYDIAGFSELVSVLGKTRLDDIVVLLPKNTMQPMGADKLTRRALPWCPATALQGLKREQPFPVYCALLHNITVKPYLTISFG
ncbi:MAG: hypothetical protein KDF49_08035, partial [Nitrosomonas sp.]|nr:hypothetical protein [Nitrosomonas sp.]